MAEQLTFPTEINIGEFVSKEAHDLKSPFNRIVGFMKLVLKGMDGPITDQARDDLTTAYTNTQYAIFLLSGLIEMARMDRGERQVSLTSCQVRPLLQQTIMDWKRQYPQDTPIEVASAAPDSVILADEAILHMGLLYWISYVVQYAPQDTAVHIQVDDQEQSCLFTIRSNGKKVRPPAKCDLTMYGYIARETLALHQGVLHSAEETEDGAVIEFSIAKP